MWLHKKKKKTLSMNKKKKNKTLTRSMGGISQPKLIKFSLFKIRVASFLFTFATLIAIIN